MKHLFAFLRFRLPVSANLPFLAVAAIAMFPTPAAAEYKLQPGDTVEVVVTGIPDLTQRSLVGVGGEISVPLVGQLNVSRLSLPDARAKVTQALSNKLYQQTAADGREIQHLILPETIIVSVVEYRPIYVNGDVAKPGELPFRPGMTVRQAVATAGGYDLVQFRSTSPDLQAADFRSDYESLWAQFAIQQARVWRLRAELGQQDGEYIKTAPIPAALADQVKQVENEQLKARLADRDRDRALLQEAIRKANLQLDALAEKKKKDEEGNQADTDEYEKVRTLTNKGFTSTARLSEERRAVLLSSDQLLQTTVEISNLERQRDDYARQLEKIDSQAHIDDWKDLQDANLQLAQIVARLKSTGDKLLYTDLLPSQVLPGRGGHPDITVYRRVEDSSERIVANEDLELAPGDVIDVALLPKANATTPGKTLAEGNN